MMAWKSLGDMDVAGKRVLTRVDINVPLEGGRVADDTRIQKTRGTVSAIRKCGGVPVLISHLGRPKGAPDKAYSLAQLVPSLESAYGSQVRFCAETVGDSATGMTLSAAAGEICLLENVRFNPGETANDNSFAAGLAQLGDVYCNDAFSACHRSHASIVGVARLLPSCAGLQLEKELRALHSALESPQRPLMAIVGGSKVSTKLAVLEHLVERVDLLLIGGAMANTFLLAKGLSVGRSLVEASMTEVALQVLQQAKRSGCRIVLPSDAVVASALEAAASTDVVSVENCPEDQMILDAGPESTGSFIELMRNCRTLVWNGPVGAFEVPPFDAATNRLAAAAAQMSKTGGLVVVAGGGDTVSALRRANAIEALTHVSTAGGAFLEWMEGRVLPGIQALDT